MRTRTDRTLSTGVPRRRAGWLVVVMMVSAASAQAEPGPEAEKLFRDGRALIKAGKLAEACDAFAASAHLDPAVGTLLNLGACRLELQQTASAWGAFAEAGRQAHKQHDPRQAEADKRAAEIEAHLSYLTIAVAPAARIAGLEISRAGARIDPSLWNQAIPIDPGQYELVATAAGRKRWKLAATVARDGDRVVATVPVLEPEAPAPIVRAATPPPASVITSRPAPHRTWTTARTIGVAAGGAGVLGVGVSLALALHARGLEGEARTLCPAGQPCRDLEATRQSERAVSQANLATAIGAVGLGAIAAGAALWLIGRPHTEAHPEDPEVTVIPTASAESVGLSMTGSF